MDGILANAETGPPEDGGGGGGVVQPPYRVRLFAILWTAAC